MVTPAHGERCPITYSSYCLNGGTCYILPTSNPFCWCKDSFKGSRCEEFMLLSQQPDRTISPSLIVIIVVTLLIALSVIIGATYFYCRKWRQKRSNQRNSSPYHTVTTRGAANIREILSVRFSIKKQDVDCRSV